MLVIYKEFEIIDLNRLRRLFKIFLNLTMRRTFLLSDHAVDLIFFNKNCFFTRFIKI